MNGDSKVLTLGQRGVLTVPKEIRESYGLRAGDHLSLLDLGGAFVLSPRLSEIDALAARIEDKLDPKDASLEDMLKTVREEREQYGKADQGIS